MKTKEKPDLPKHLAEKAAAFPEWRMGASRVTLVLNNGERIRQVFLAWGETIVRIGDKEIESKEDIDFDMAKIDDVISEI